MDAHDRACENHAMRCVGLTAIILAAIGGEASAQQVQHSANILINAGFVARAADTPEKLMRLKRFPLHQFASRKTADGRIYYVYADPTLCVCAYVGTQAAMDSYRRLRADALGTNWFGVPPGAGGGGGGVTPTADIIHDMQNDDMENAFNDDVFHPGF